MNNEWNSEVVTDVPESDITVDQAYDATSSNPQSGTAVAGAIDGVKQLPASTAADATKVLTVDSSGVPGWAQAASGGATWTSTKYTTGATVNQGIINIPMDDPLPIKVGANLFSVWFRAQLKNGVPSAGNYSIKVSIGNANANAIVYMSSGSTDVFGDVVIAGVWNNEPSTLPPTLQLFSNGGVGGGFVATGTVSAKVSLLN